jgi:hypothetical protein
VSGAFKATITAFIGFCQYLPKESNNMSITIEIRPTLEQRLREKAKDRGVDIDDIIEQVLENWSENAQEESQETETSLLKKINRDRLLTVLLVGVSFINTKTSGGNN